jgi:hypothetical protein
MKLIILKVSRIAIVFVEMIYFFIIVLLVSELPLSYNYPPIRPIVTPKLVMKIPTVQEM